MKKKTKFQIVKNKILDNRFSAIIYNQKENEIMIPYLSGGSFGCTLRKVNLDGLVKEILKDPVLSNLSLSKPLSEKNANRLMKCCLAFFIKNLKLNDRIQF